MFYGTWTIVGYLIPSQFLCLQTVLFQTIQFSISSFFFCTQLNIKPVLYLSIQFTIITQFHCQKTVLFQTIHFSISSPFQYQTSSISIYSVYTQFSSIWPIDRTLSGATTPRQSGPESDGNDGYSTFSKLQHYWNFTIRLFNVISRTLWGEILPLCRDAVGIFCWLSRLGNIYIYIYTTVIHRQICFVLSELISVARQYLPVAGIETRLTQTPSQSF